MDWPRACAGVIPCFNEAHSIAEVVSGVRRHLPTAIVVDDGSSDASADHAAKAGGTVIRQAANRGKGAALRAGWRCARDLGFDWAMTLDGDGQHAPDDIPAFFDCAERTGAGLVIGDRMGGASEMPWLRRWVNRWMTRRVSRLTGVPLADSQCGFRLVNLNAWSGLDLAANRFEIESELLVAAVRAGVAVEFVPIQVIYSVNRSKIRPVVDSWRWLRWWLAQSRQKQ